LQVFARRLGCTHDGIVVAVQLDSETRHRLAGQGDRVDDLFGPLFLDADHHHRSHVGIAAGADERTEVQIEVGAELQPAIGMRDRHGPFDVVRDRLGGRVGQIIDGKNDHVVADADAAVLPPVTPETFLHDAQTPKNATIEIDAVVRDLGSGSGNRLALRQPPQVTSAWS
jgi:hypothetical protein